MLVEIVDFLSEPHCGVEKISNEHGLQLELGVFLRASGYRVEFEKPFSVQSSATSTKKPKRELDILASRNNKATAIELKVPLAGRVPETMYDFCADIEFVESLIRAKSVGSGVCLLITNNRQFWQSPGSAAGIYEFFRGASSILTGCVTKPTGAKDTSITLAGSDNLAGAWADLGNSNLLSGARYLLVEVK